MSPSSGLLQNYKQNRKQQRALNDTQQIYIFGRIKSKDTFYISTWKRKIKWLKRVTQNEYNLSYALFENNPKRNALKKTTT